MVLDQGDIVHVIERRLFEEDVRRHFVGKVAKCTERALRVQGYVFVHDRSENTFVRRLDVRDRVFSLDNRIILNVLPRDINLEKVGYATIDEGLIVSDGKTFTLNINEFGPRR